MTKNKFFRRKILLVWNKHLRPKSLILIRTEEPILIRGDHPPSLARTTSVVLNAICLQDSQRVHKADILTANVCLRCTRDNAPETWKRMTHFSSPLSTATSLTSYQNYSGLQYSCQIQRGESIRYSSIFRMSTTSFVKLH